LRRDYVLAALIIIILTLAMITGFWVKDSVAGQVYDDPIVARSYLQKAVEQRLGPVEQEIKETQKRLDALEQRLKELGY